MWLFLSLSYLKFAFSLTKNQGWLPCANLTFTENETVDVEKVLYDCIDFIPASQIPPSYYSVNGNGYQPINVSVQFAINNLISVNDLQSQITIDFYFRCLWQDPRIFIPDMWDYLNPEASLDGLVITPMIEDPNNPLNVWFPDFYFTDATEQQISSQSIKLRPNGTLYWSRHFVLTISQPSMDFERFPLDSQNFSIRFQSISYDSNILRAQFVPNGVVLLTEPQNGYRENIARNVLWQYDYWTAFIANTDQPIDYNPTRKFWVGYVNLKFTRDSDGVIYRLALPVIICVIVVGFALWAAVEKRIEVTLQMLLVTAALYLVIGQIIPFVGYLTTMDIFVTTIYICLAAVTGINFLYLQLELKQESHPMNLFYRTVLITFLRVAWMPVAIILYIAFFEIDTPVVYTLLSLICVIMAVYGVWRIDVISEAFEYSIRNLRAKANYLGTQLHAVNRKDPAIYGEKLVKQLNLTYSEKWILHYCRHMFSQPPRIQKYTINFVKIFGPLFDSISKDPITSNTNSTPQLEGNVLNAKNDQTWEDINNPVQNNSMVTEFELFSLSDQKKK